MFGVLLALGMFVSSTSAAVFHDVPAGHRFFNEINYLYNFSVISGYENGNFGPDDKVTRAAAAAMIGRALDLDGQQRATNFTDVKSSSFASGYIASAAERGIIMGYSDGTFRPNAVLTRGQMAILIARAFELSDTSSIRFTDVTSSNSSFYDSIYKIVEAGITNGYPDGTFKSDVHMTRAQFSAFLTRALNDDFKVSPPVIPDLTWKGEWTRESVSNPGLLEITNVTQSSFDFLLNVMSGAHVGEIEGRAKVSGMTASYKDNSTGCQLNFTHKGESIQIEQTMGCNQYGGMGTYFGGEFELDPIEMEPSLYPYVIDSKAVDEKFRQLVGNDYEDFAYNMQSISVAKDNQVNGTVISGGVRGLYTFMEGIVIIGQDGHLYGAVIKDSEKVHYYTTNSVYKNKLPQSIAKWKERFSSYPVKYFYQGVKQTPQGINPQQAEQIIREALQVPDSTSVVYEYDNGEHYVIHVYDVVKDDISSHNATRGWYEVNRKTGEWYDQFDLYFN